MSVFTAPAATLLLVDSDAVMRAAVHDALTDGGYFVVTANGLAEAVDHLDEIRPDLLIIRPHINSMSGRTAASQLRRRRPGMPVLVIAGFLDDDRVHVEHTNDNLHMFPRPFSREELLAKVSEIVGA